MDAHVMRLLKVCFGKEGGGSMLMLLLPPYTRNEFPAYSPRCLCDAVLQAAQAMQLPDLHSTCAGMGMCKVVEKEL